jgi:hypothetical protein
MPNPHEDNQFLIVSLKGKRRIFDHYRNLGLEAYRRRPWNRDRATHSSEYEEPCDG